MAGANIDQLNFEVILDDDRFRDRVQQDIDLAKDLNTSLSDVLKIKVGTKQIVSSTGVKNAKDIAKYLDDIARKINSMPRGQFLVGDADALNKTLTQVSEQLDKIINKTGSAQNGFGKMNSTLSQSRDLMSDLSKITGITFGAAGLRSFISSLVRISGEFEVQKMSLTSMLQDAGKADKIFNDLRQRALESPYTFQDLTKYAKQLTAFNIDADQLVETERRLADVAAGLGVDMGRIILAYGQVKSAGVLKGTELRQFTEAGVPLLQSLADQIEQTTGKTVNLAKVFDMISKKQIPFEMVEQAFRDMTSEGGKFYNMQEVLVNTLQGKIGKLRDVWQQALYEVGKANSGPLKWTVDRITDLVSNFSKFGGIINSLVVGFGAYVTILGIAATAQRLVFGVEAIANISKTIKAIRSAQTAMEGFAAASHLASTASFALAAIVGVGYAIFKAYSKANEEAQRLNRALDENDKAIKNEISNLNVLKDRLESAKKGTKEYNDAKNEIVKNYGKYYNGLDNEITKVGSLKTAYDKLKESIEESMRVRGYSEFEAQEKKIYDDAIEGSLGKIKNRLQRTRKDLTRASVNTIMNEINRVILNGGTYEDFAKTKVNEEFFPAGKYIGDIKQIFSSAASARDEYLKNTRQAIKDFNLKGTIFDPDLTGPVPSNKTDSNNNSTWIPADDSATKKNIETTIDAIKELQRAYKDFRQMGLDDKTILGIFAQDSMFGYLDKDLRSRLDYWDMLLEQAAKLEAYDQDAANRVRADVARGKADEQKKEWQDQQKALEDRQRALEKYQKTLQKWQKDYGGRYTGFDSELDKVVVDYNNELQKIDDEYIAAQQEIYEAYSDNVDVIKEETDALYELYQARRKAAYGNADIALSNLAQKHVKDATSGLDLSDWGDKSIGQVYGLYKLLGGLAEGALTGDLKISDGVSKELTEAGLSIEDFTKLSFDEFKKLEKTAKEELLKKLGATLKEVAGDISDVAASYKDWAEASGDLELATTISDLQELGSIISNVAQRALQEDWIGAILAGVAGIAKSIFETKAEIAELESSLRALNEEARKTQFENILSSGVESIFGTNDLQKVENAISAISKARDSMREYMSDISSMGFNTTKRNIWARIFGASTNENNPTFNKSSIEGMAKAVGGKLYDAYGNLNAKTLKAILDTYKNLDVAQREWIDHAINDSEAYAEAMEQIDEVAESIFGNIVSNVADRMVDSWWEAGQAALNYADILGDVAKAYAKLIVQDMLMQTAFDTDRQEALKDAFKKGDASRAMQIVTEAMQSAEQMLPAVNAALQAFEPYRNATGDSSDTSSVGVGIKGITEDTANLLASYINAIRADVSYMRLMQESGWKDVAAIAGAVASPTLNDYMNQVAANTYDTAQSNRQILLELQSVIGSPGSSGMVVRVESY